MIDGHGKKRIIWVGAGMLVLAALVYTLRTVLAPVFLSLVIAYLLDPLVDRIEARKIPRTPAIFILLAAFLFGVATLILLVVPVAQREASEVLAGVPDYSAKLRDFVIPWAERISGKNLPSSLSEVIDELSATLQTVSPDSIRPFAAIIRKIFSNTLYVIFALLNLVIVPVFVFYFLRDFDKMKAYVMSLVPLAYKDWTAGKFKKVDETIGAFMRGQLGVCTILAALYSAGLMIVGVDMAVIIGVSAGYLFIVPYLGTIFGIVAASLMALLKYHDWAHLLGVWAVFGIVQLFETYFLTPRIIGDRVGLNPATVILSLLVGAGLFGFLGILIAVPAAAVIKIFAGDLIDYYRASDVYLGGVGKEVKKT